MGSEPLRPPETQVPEAAIDLTSPPWVDLRQYDVGDFDRGRPAWFVLLWWVLQPIVFTLTPHSFHGPRLALLRLFGAKIGKGVVLRPTVRVTFPWKVEIGDYSWVGDQVVLYSLERITIGQHCVISQKSYLCTGSHDVQDPRFRLQVAPIAIGNGAWVATDCFLGPGVKIGANAVVGGPQYGAGEYACGSDLLGHALSSALSPADG